MITKKGNKYYVVSELPRDPLTGKRKRKWSKGFDTKKQARAYEVEVQHEINSGLFVEPSNKTLRDYMTEWLQDKGSQIRPSTLRSYKWLVNMHIIGRIGDLKLSKVTPSHLQALYRELQQSDKPLSPRSILHLHLILQDALERAVKWGYITKNSAKLVDPPRVNEYQYQIWTWEETQRFLSAAYKDRYFIAFLLAISTGMRKGEILALRWQDTDLDNEHVSVVRSFVYADKGYKVQEPKTRHSKRSVALFTEVVELLKQHKVCQDKEKLISGDKYQDNDLIVATQMGTYVTHRNLDRSWYRIQKVAQVPKIRFHDLRHTHASLMLQIGAHAKIVSERLGHANIGLTLDTYTHVLPGLQEKVARQFGQALFRGIDFEKL